MTLTSGVAFLDHADQGLADRADAAEPEDTARSRSRAGKRLQERRHPAEPSGIDEQQMLGPVERLLDLPDGFRRRVVPKVLFGAQERKVQVGDLDAPDLVADFLRALR